MDDSPNARQVATFQTCNVDHDDLMKVVPMPTMRGALGTGFVQGMLVKVKALKAKRN